MLLVTQEYPLAACGLQLFCAALEASGVFNLLNVTGLSYSSDCTDWGKERSV